MSLRVGVIACCVLMAAAILSMPVVCASDTYAGWEQAVLIETNDAPIVGNHDVALDAYGNAIAAWRQYDGGSYTIWSNRYEKGSGWGDAVAISEARTQMGDPSVAVNDMGDGLVAWNQYGEDATMLNVVMNYYQAGNGWSGVTMVEDADEGHAWAPDVAADAAGDFFIAWYQSDGAYHDALCRKYSRDAGLGDLWTLDSGETEDVLFVKIGTDALGGAVAVWKENLSAPFSVVSNTYRPETGWGTPEVVDHGHISNGMPILSVEPGGNATCAWQHMETYYQIWGNNYSVESGWGTATDLRVLTLANAMYPAVGYTGYGKSIVVWQEWGAGSWEGICGIELDASGWGSAALIAHSGDGLASNPSIASGVDGDAITVFSIGLNSMFNEIWAIQYNTDLGWGCPEKISEPDLGDANNPLVRINEAGDATAVWQQSSGVQLNVWACCKPGLDVDPPDLSISSPSDEEVVESQIVTVEGSTEAGATLVVNGILASVGSDGSFSLELPLLEGENTILAVATDSSGNTATASITVTYVVPPNPFEDDLEDAIDAILQLRDELNETVGGLEETLGELTTSLEDLQNELNETLADLAETDDDLSSAEEQLEEADGRIDSLSSRVNLMMAVLIAVFVLLGLTVLMYLRLRRAGVRPPEE